MEIVKTVFREAVLAVMFTSAIVHAGDPQQEAAFPSFNSGVVVQDANLTWRNYVEWWNKTQGTPLSGDSEIATNLWADAIVRLHPVYVYTHGINIVIVRSRQGEDEEGFYVALSIASSPGANDGQFSRMLIAQHAGGSVFTFKRRGHLERTQTQRLKEKPVNHFGERVTPPVSHNAVPTDPRIKKPESSRGSNSSHSLPR